MAEALILDAEAVNALARPDERRALFERARAILSLAHERQALVRVPSAVLAELYRGPRFDAQLDRVLKSRGLVVCDLTRNIAVSAGHLLSKAKLPSSSAVDAFVVATALTFERAIIATGDVDDIRRLAAPYNQIVVYGL